MTHWLDFRGEYRALTPRQLGVRAEFMALVGGGNTEWLWTCWPRFATRKIDGELRVAIVGWVLTGAVDWLLKLAGEQPIWGPHVITRRPGVWPGETGAPIVHCGNVIWIDGDLQPAGMRTGNLIWPACPAEARPGAPCRAGDRQGHPDADAGVVDVPPGRRRHRRTRHHRQCVARRLAALACFHVHRRRNRGKTSGGCYAG